MRRKLISLILALCLAASLGGCREETREPGPEETFEELLAADYEIDHLIHAGGLAADSGQSKMLENALYWLVTSSEYSTMDALQKRLEGIYLRGETVRTILGTEDANGQPLLRSQDGRLWRSASPASFALGYEVEEGTVTLVSSTPGTAAFSFHESGLDGSLYETRLSMTRTNGGWRLDGPRWEAERVLIREGSDKASLVSAGAARRAAEEFLGSITDGGTPSVRGVELGNTGAWQNIRIRSAVLTGAVEELDSQGTYTVRVDVEEGGGVFPVGEQDYRLEMRCDVLRFGDKVYPAYFRPVSEEYYNWNSHVQENQGGPGPAAYVDSFIRYYGWTTFRDPSELPAETVVEYSLLFARSAEGDQRFTPAELRDAVRRTFGITGFDGSGTSFYMRDQDRYLLWGRGGDSHDLLIGMPRMQGGQAQVEAAFYGDVLCTSPLRTIRYTLEEGKDGSWQLLSALPVEGDGGE